MTRLHGIGAGFLVLGATALSGWAAERDAVPGAVEAVAATLDVERTLLDEDVARHRRLALARTQDSARLEDLHRALDAAVERRDDTAVETVDGLLGQIEEIERERAEDLAVERLVVERILDRLRRIRLFEDQLQSLEARAERQAGPLEGRWTIALLPLNQKGTFDLRQSGTIISGTYELQGGWSGSLQGTLVERKVHLVRIDSKLGRSMEFEGVLSTDGGRIRGTWLSFDVSGGSSPNGQWSAVRASSASPSE